MARDYSELDRLLEEVEKTKPKTIEKIDSMGYDRAIALQRYLSSNQTVNDKRELWSHGVCLEGDEDTEEYKKWLDWVNKISEIFGPWLSKS